jgi:hypothetical protein
LIGTGLYVKSAMIQNPFFIEVSRPTGSFRTLELIPVYRKERDHYVATRDFRIYAGYAADDYQHVHGDALKEQYFDNLELMGNDNPCFLGELRFNGLAYFEWKYLGDQLCEREVWQIVDLVQNCVKAYLA